MRFKYTVFPLLTAALLWAQPCLAQNGPPPPPADIESHLQEDLGLSEQQVSQLRPVFAAIKQARRKRFDDMQKRLESILTAGQQQLLDSMKRSGDDGPPPPRIDDELHLSQQQRAQLQTWHKEDEAGRRKEMDSFKRQIEAVLTPAQKAKFENMKPPPPPGGDRPHHHDDDNDDDDGSPPPPR